MELGKKKKEKDGFWLTQENKQILFGEKNHKTPTLQFSHVPRYARGDHGKKRIGKKRGGGQKNGSQNSGFRIRIRTDPPVFAGQKGKEMNE